MTDAEDARRAIVGVWQLLAYQDRTSEAEPWEDTFGTSPVGLAVYHPSGLLSMQVFADAGAADAEFPFIGYIGNYLVRESARQGDGFSGVLEHHMKAASDPTFLIEDVARVFAVSGSQLLLGDDRTWRRTWSRLS